MTATLSDVAARAGVSISAVSRVLANAPSARVRPETRERIEQAAQELGYRPNFAGRALKLARSRVLALVVPDVTNAIFSELMRGVEDAAIDHDHVVLLGRSEDMQPGGSMITKLVGERRVDGVLLQLRDEASRADAAALLRDGEQQGGRSAVVFINSLQDRRAGSVSLPDEQAAAVATRSLVALGHTAIGFLGGLPTAFTAQAREDGFRRLMAEAAVPVRSSWVTDLGYTADQGRQALRKVWSRSRRPTAVVVANLNAAIGVLAEARALGISVPSELSVVALHDAWTAEHTAPALSTVRMPLYQLGRAAVEQLISELDRRSAEQRGPADRSSLQNSAGRRRRRNLVITDPGPELIMRDSATAPGRTANTREN